MLQQLSWNFREPKCETMRSLVAVSVGQVLGCTDGSLIELRAGTEGTVVCSCWGLDGSICMVDVGVGMAGEPWSRIGFAG